MFGNPKAFIRLAYSYQITFSTLNESMLCLGKQATARLFIGKSSKMKINSLSSASLDVWMNTFKFVRSHIDIEDNDIYQSRVIQPTDEWYSYLQTIKTPIDQDRVQSWSRLSKKELALEAQLIGITIGIKNTKASKYLLERMIETIKRRENCNWFEEPCIVPLDVQEDYRLMNVFRLRELCKERSITSVHLKKDEMIQKLKEYNDLNKECVEEEKTLDNYNSRQLKEKCKELGFTSYNHLKKDELVKLVESIEEKDNHHQLVLNDVEIIARQSDKYINATQLCKAGNKRFTKWYGLKRTKDFLNELTSVVPNGTTLIEINQGGENQWTWIHPKVAISLATWCSPKFEVIVVEWIHELLTSGSVKLQRPLKMIMPLSQVDIEAEHLELENEISKFTNKNVLYVAYIGDGLVKNGFTHDITKRKLKHTSCESQYKQWRIIKCFEISNQKIEFMVKRALAKYSVPYKKQIEIFKPKCTLKEYLNEVNQLLFSYDLEMRIRKQEIEILQLKEQIALLKGQQI